MYFKISRLLGVVLLLLPTFAFAQTVSSTQATSTTSVVATSTATTTPDYTNPANVQARVESSFADIPVMIAIAKCESGFTQFNSTGQVLGESSGSMIGIYQINKPVHYNLALSLGYDIDTVDGNIGFARYLYTQSGTDPWISSFSCWSGATTNPENATSTLTASAINSLPAPAAPIVSVPIQVTTPSVPSGTTPAPSLTANLSFGMNDPQVVTLQQMLNALGYTIATTGPGSKGNETTMFGNFTRASVRQFQCAKGIVCSGDEGSTGYGYVGNRTRAALLSAMVGNSTSVSTTSQSPISAPSPSAGVSTSNATQIAALQAQVANYQQLISGLTAQIAALQKAQ